jgi:beta-lactamase class A
MTRVFCLGICLICLLFTLPVCTAASPVRKASEKRMTEAERKTLITDIETLIKQSDTEMVGVAFHDLATGDEIKIRAEERIHPASTIKLTVLAEAFHQAEQGKLKLDDRIPIIYTFTSNGPGAPPFTLTSDDDSEKTLYNRTGESETIRELCRLMIVRSSNLATNLLYDRLGVDSVNAYMHKVGAGDLLLKNHLQDQKAFETGKTNLASAGALCKLLIPLAEKRLVSKAASEEMIEILRGQEFKQGIPAGLPPGISVAHKTGSITKIYHDAGIVYPPNDRKPYVIVVLTKGIADMEKAQKLVAAISGRIYNAVVPSSAN